MLPALEPPSPSPPPAVVVVTNLVGVRFVVAVLVGDCGSAEERFVVAVLPNVDEGDRTAKYDVVAVDGERTVAAEDPRGGGGGDNDDERAAEPPAITVHA